MTNEQKQHQQLVLNFLDAPTGYGKTTAIINKVNREIPEGYFGNPKRFLVVTPFIDEVTRICKETACTAPIGNKSKDIQTLLADGENICCTHSLFNLFSTETLEIISTGGYSYSLIIDEEINVISDIMGNKTIRNKENPSLIESYSKKDFEILIKQEQISIDPLTKKISWNDDYSYDDGVFDDLRKRLEIVDLFRFGSGLTQMVKRELWECFNEVTICSYRMKESYLAYYCRLSNIGINYQHIENGVIVNGYLPLKPKKLDRIKLYPDQRNKECSYSKYWYQQNIKKDFISKAAKQLTADFRKFKETFVPKGVDKSLYFWTCYKGYEKALAGKNLSKNKWQPCNIKATNKLVACCIVGYFVNRFANVNVKRFLKDTGGIIVNEEELALSELIQFVWRSNIRTDDLNDVYVFIAADALLNNFSEWLKDE